MHGHLLNQALKQLQLTYSLLQEAEGWAAQLIERDTAMYSRIVEAEGMIFDARGAASKSRADRLHKRLVVLKPNLAEVKKRLGELEAKLEISQSNQGELRLQLLGLNSPCGHHGGGLFPPTHAIYKLGL